MTLINRLKRFFSRKPQGYSVPQFPENKLLVTLLESHSPKAIWQRALDLAQCFDVPTDTDLLDEKVVIEFRGDATALHFHTQSPDEPITIINWQRVTPTRPPQYSDLPPDLIFITQPAHPKQIPQLLTAGNSTENPQWQWRIVIDMDYAQYHATVTNL